MVLPRTILVSMDPIAAGIEKAKQAHAELYIHGRDGQIRERQIFALAFAESQASLRIISE